MMISDQPEADADHLDDEELLETYLGAGGSTSRRASGAVPSVADWPTRYVHEVGLQLDGDTLAWFQARHADWQAEMSFVLRAWVKAHAGRPPAT